MSLSSSPGRGLSQTISRPDWPWAANSSHRLSSTSSIHSGGSNTPGGYVAANQSGYGSRAELRSAKSWSYTGFEWRVDNVTALRDFIEGSDSGSEVDDADFEVLKASPLLDGKFKLEIARSPSDEIELAASASKTISIYITSPVLEYAPDFEQSCGLMVSIKAVGERGARADWLWEHWQPEFVFRPESEVWECTLPTLSDLLENPRVQETDAFIICIQIHSPMGPLFPSQPGAYYVPRDLIDGVEASLDNANTGDVRFICLERMPADQSVATPSTPGDRSSSRSSASPLTSYTTARKRIIYAHSDILIARSEYFATMLTSSFAETTSGRGPGDRKVFTVVVEEADFETIYWLCKWLYANYLKLKPVEDYRTAVDGVGAGWSAKWLGLHGGGEWDWKTSRKGAGGHEDDRVSASSGDSLLDHGKSLPGTTPTLRAPPPPSSRTTTGVSPSKPLTALVKSPSNPQPSSSRRPPIPITTTAPGASRIQGGGTKPISIPGPNYASYPISPRAQRSHPSLNLSTDPHPHPTPAPPPASALSMYQVAHRYAMPGLAALALEHLLATITPQSSFSLLLASSVWDELRSLVEDYVVEKWEEVSACDEFEQCCQEIAAGEWGDDGSKTLVTVFRRLRAPPTPLPYTRAL